MKCDNGCTDPAENSFGWPTSRGPQLANLCGSCGSLLWSNFKHTHAMESVVIDEPLTEEQKRRILANYQSANQTENHRG